MFSVEIHFVSVVFGERKEETNKHTARLFIS